MREAKEAALENNISRPLKRGENLRILAVLIGSHVLPYYTKVPVLLEILAMLSSTIYLASCLNLTTSQKIPPTKENSKPKPQQQSYFSSPQNVILISMYYFTFLMIIYLCLEFLPKDHTNYLLSLQINFLAFVLVFMSIQNLLRENMKNAQANIVFDKELPIDPFSLSQKKRVVISQFNMICFSLALGEA